MIAWSFFVLTLLLEAPVVYAGYRNVWKRALMPFVLLNLFTWPLLHYLLISTTLDINLLEAGVTIAEATGYYLLVEQKAGKAILVSLLANGFSYGTGIIINHFMR
ncbi:MAG: hypothetical protein NTW29_12025 [Bacteroidetes bacterium]|nr:hypothetical protein [Bacteroidota bacterium]